MRVPPRFALEFYGPTGQYYHIYLDEYGKFLDLREKSQARYPELDDSTILISEIRYGSKASLFRLSELQLRDDSPVMMQLSLMIQTPDGFRQLYEGGIAPFLKDSDRKKLH